MLYNYIYLEDNTAYGAKYWWHHWAENKKTENTKDMEHSALFSLQQTETQHNPFKKMQQHNLILGCTNRCQNIWETSKVFKLKNWNIQIWARQVSGAHSWWAKNAQICHRIRKQLHPRPARTHLRAQGIYQSGKWPWLGHGAVLAASKPLQVSKYLTKLYTATRLYLTCIRG